MALPPATHLGPYEIAGLLGAGGMGEVYHARDPRLDRDVAIKVLPEDLAGDPERLRRFEKEARAAGALNHPNILAVHDVGAHDGRPYLVTELLEGETLRERLTSAALPAEKAVEHAIQIARGLAAAHDKGIVHRDLKPENLFVTKDGLVKILDFGLAKLRGPQGQRGSGDDVETASRTTNPGAVIGTAGYMSPEQVRGQPVDHRSDIFSFGAVLYEMLSGQRAFRGDSSVEVLSAILKEEPPDIRSNRPDVPATLPAAVDRCLEKRPEDRFHSAHDLALALELTVSGREPATRSSPRWGWVRARSREIAVGAALMIATLVGAAFWVSRPGREEAPGVTTADPASPTSSPASAEDTVSSDRIAVAVFRNDTGHPDLNTLGLMAADWVTDGLSRVRSLDVALAPTAAFGAGGTVNAEALAAHSDPRTVSKRAGAGLVVSGAYALQGDDLVLRARLTAPESGRTLLALEPVAGPLARPAEVAEALRRTVVSAVAFHHDIDFDAGAQRPPSFEAYREYARAMELWYLEWPPVIEHLENAVSLDPRFVHAHVCLTLAYSLVGDFEEAERQLATLEALEDLTPFERLNRRYARASLAGRNSECLTLMREMERVAPGVSWIPFDRGVWAYATNRPEESERALARVGRLLAGGGWTVPDVYAQPLHLLGRFEDQYRVASAGLEEYPTILYLHEQQAAALAALGRFEDLERVVSSAARAQPSSGTAGLVMLVAAMELRAHGHRPEADAMATRAVEWYLGASPEMFRKLQTPNRGLEWYRSWPRDITKRLREEHASALYWAGRWSESEALVAELAAEEPENVVYLGWLGTLAARRGRPTDARRADETLRTVNRQFLFGLDSYWRGAIAAQLGEKRQAVKLLNEAFARGHYFQTHLHRNIDFEPLWDYPPFLELLRPKG